MQQTTKTQGWHVANWGVLGWLETVIKLVGIFAGWIALAGSTSTAGLMLAGNPRLPAVIVFSLLTLITLLVPFARIMQREVISVIYAFLNLIGHLSMLIALLRVTDQRGLAILFGICFVAGEIVKQRFMATSGYTEGGATSAMMVNLSRAIMVVYILFVVLMLI